MVRFYVDPYGYDVDTRADDFFDTWYRGIASVDESSEDNIILIQNL